MKHPVINHDPAHQQRLLADGARQDLIAWLCWNDPNGVYRDEDSDAEGMLPITLSEARAVMARQLADA